MWANTNDSLGEDGKATAAHPCGGILQDEFTRTRCGLECDTGFPDHVHVALVVCVDVNRSILCVQVDGRSNFVENATCRGAQFYRQVFHDWGNACFSCLASAAIAWIWRASRPMDQSVVCGFSPLGVTLRLPPPKATQRYGKTGHFFDFGQTVGGGRIRIREPGVGFPRKVRTYPSEPLP